MVRIEEAGQVYYSTVLDVTLVEDKIFQSLRQALYNDADYNGKVQKRFDWLLFALVKFLHSRMEQSRQFFPYLGKFDRRSKAPKESALQNDLFDFLVHIGCVDIERSAAAGRADLYLPMDGFRFVIEVKRLLDDWDKDVLAFIGQTAAYGQTDVRLGILAVLDLTERQPGEPHIDQCFEVRNREFSPGDVRRVVIMRVPGNRRTPREHVS